MIIKQLQQKGRLFNTYLAVWPFDSIVCPLNQWALTFGYTHTYTFCFRGFFLGEAASLLVVVAFASKGVAGAAGVFPFNTAVVATLGVGAASLDGSLLTLLGDTGAVWLTAGCSVVVTLAVVTAAVSFDWLPESLRQQISYYNELYIKLSLLAKKKN